MPALEKAHGERIAHAVCLLRRDLTGLKGLAHLIGDHVALLLPAGEGFVLPLREQKLRVGGFRAALIGGDQLAALRLFGIF